MSSILKALKRLEKEYSANQEIQTWNRAGGKDLVASRMVKGLWFPGRTLLVLLIICILSLSGWLIFKEVPFSHQRAVSTMAPIPSATLYQERTEGFPLKASSEEKPGKNRPKPIQLRKLPRRRRNETLSKPGPKRIQGPPEPVRAARIQRPQAREKLVLQAIAWSRNPSKRMAVINNRVMHEKGSIFGFEVVRIGPDEVYIKKGAKEVRLTIESGK